VVFGFPDQSFGVYVALLYYRYNYLRRIVMKKCELCNKKKKKLYESPHGDICRECFIRMMGYSPEEEATGLKEEE
jgi:hypothetical protein